MSRSMTDESQLHPGCGCTSHQPIYHHWPIENVTIRVSSCMCVCPYCGHVFSNASRLRKHLRQKKYRKRNIVVEPERAGAAGIRQDPLYFSTGAVFLQIAGRRVVFHVPLIFPAATMPPLPRHRRDKEIAHRKQQTCSRREAAKIC